MLRLCIVVKILNVLIAGMVFLSLSFLSRELLVMRFGTAVDEKSHYRSESEKLHANQRAFSEFEAILESGIFGRGLVFPIWEQIEVEAHSNNVSLIGTVVGSPGATYAVFFDSFIKKEEIVSKGEVVFDVGILKAIYEDKALVDFDGNSLVFYLSGSKPPGSSEGTKLSGGHKAWAKGIAKKGSMQWAIDKRTFDDILNNMNTVLTDAKMVPHGNGGKMAGFRISDIKQGSIFNLLGLLDGDILLSVNNFQIDSLEKSLQLIAGLKGESKLSVEILRDYKPLQLTFLIR